MTALATESRAWHEQDIDAVATCLATDPERGLSTAEAGRRLSDVGPNELHERAGRTVGQILWEQVSSILLAILIIAAGLAAALGKPVDAAAILAIVILFVVLGVVQEHRAQKAIARSLTLGQLAVGAGLALGILVMEIDKALRRRSRQGAPKRRELAAGLV